MNGINPGFRAGIAAPRFSAAVVQTGRTPFQEALHGETGLSDALKSGDAAKIAETGRVALKLARDSADFMAIIGLITDAYLDREKRLHESVREENQADFRAKIEELLELAFKGAFGK